MKTILDVERLTISLPTFSPVQDLSFAVHGAETVALVGESGSGKSLTALALMRLLPTAARITGGRARFLDNDLLSLRESEMRRIRGAEIGMIFQDPMASLNPVLSVGSQIAEVCRIHLGLSSRAARARSVELLDLVRIPEPQRRTDEYPHELSGGMRQRVMMAMAVACSPKLIIADEPTTALDVTIQAQILELLHSLCRDMAMAVILITHDLGVVGQWADRVVVMYAGRKVEEADPDELFGNPQHPYTKGLLGASPRVASGLNYRQQALTEIPGSITSAVGASGCSFAPRCSYVAPSCLNAHPALTETRTGHLAACPILPALEQAHESA